jgi:hypothetical protein
MDSRITTIVSNHSQLMNAHLQLSSQTSQFPDKSHIMLPIALDITSHHSLMPTNAALLVWFTLKAGSTGVEVTSGGVELACNGEEAARHLAPLA